jgi:hypothetical protein
VRMGRRPRPPPVREQRGRSFLQAVLISPLLRPRGRISRRRRQAGQNR